MEMRMEMTMRRVPGDRAMTDDQWEHKQAGMRARQRLMQANREVQLAREAMLALFEAHRAGRFARVEAAGNDPISASRDEIGILAGYLFQEARDELKAASAALVEWEAREKKGD